jgi:shikimate dehydrogenase
MKAYGLIGYPLSHSFSVGYFTNKFKNEGIADSTYSAFPMESLSHFRNLVNENLSLEGLNVTIPYKEKIIAFMDSLDPEAAEIGAVNTVKIFRTAEGFTCRGYNSDAWGFEMSLRPFITESCKQALILGTGGASRAVAHVLKKLGCQVIYVSRNPRDAQQLSYPALSAEVILGSQVIINSSPVGMYPKVSEYPDIPYELLSEQHILYDLIYNPSETLFLKKGRDQGAITINGLQMLHLQAERSWEIWNDNR